MLRRTARPGVLSPLFTCSARAYSAPPQPQALPHTASFPLQAPSTSSLFTKLQTSASSALPTNHELPIVELKQYNALISAIRRSLDSKPPKDVLKHWQSLGDLKLINRLAPQQVVPLSELMTLSFLSPGSLLTSASGYKAVRDSNPSLFLLIENIAILAARCDTLNPLNALMRCYLQQKDPQSIISLYNKYMRLVGDKDEATDSNSGDEVAGEASENEEMKDLLATDVERSWAEYSVNTGRIHLLLAAITAHAMTDSFRGALSIYLSTTVELEASIALAYLNVTLRNQPTLLNLVKQYISKLQVAKLLSQPLLFSRKVTELGLNRAGPKLENLYSNITSGLSGDAYIAADSSSITSTKPVAMNLITWNALFTAFLRCERKDLAGRLWDDMMRFGHPPGVSMWTTLLDSHARLGAFENALETWSLMLQQGIKPDALAYRSIISALFKGRRPNRAMEIFREYQTLPVQDPEHHLSLYNTVLHGLCGSDRATEAEELCATMERKGPKPDIISYNTFIAYYGRRGKFQGIAATLRTMKAAGTEGDVFTYTTVLSALLKAGKADAADLVLTLMDKQGVKRNVALYTTLIDHQLREDTRVNFDAAMRMLRWMEESRDNPPNEITYTCVLVGLYRSSWLGVEELREHEKDIIQRLKSRGIVFGVPAYNLLIKGCLVYPQENGVQQALAYFEEMKRRELPIINTTWYILLAGLLNRGEGKIAERLVEEMYASGILPSGTLLRLVYKIREGRGGG